MFIYLYVYIYIYTYTYIYSLFPATGVLLWRIASLTCARFCDRSSSVYIYIYMHVHMYILYMDMNIDSTLILHDFLSQVRFYGGSHFEHARASAVGARGRRFQEGLGDDHLPNRHVRVHGHDGSHVWWVDGQVRAVPQYICIHPPTHPSIYLSISCM